MIHDLKPYPAYKDSGVPWLGDVPEHWEVRRIKTLFREKDERNGNGHGVLLSLTRSRGILPQTEASNRIASAEDLSKYKLCQPGELVMNRMQAWSGMFAVSPLEGLVSPDYSVFKPFSASNVKYFEHLFKTPILVDQFARRSKGIGSGFNRLYTPDFGSVPVIAPSFPEQTAIVRFLNYMDRRIRCYIRAKQKLIKLLEEQKQAIIHHAVTRGLDPNVRLKPSGVEWSGKIPAHWEVLRTRYLFREVDLRSEDGEETHLSMSQKLGLVPSSMVEQRTLVSQSYAGGKLCDKNDLVLNRLKAHLGVFALAKQSGVISPDYTVLRQIRPMVVRYFEHILRSPAFRHELRVRAKGIVEGFWRLYTDDFYNIQLPVPPVNEQGEIVSALDTTTGSIRTTIERTEHEINLLLEYRTRLIADAVTGKLDVRKAAAHLPETFEGTEPLDGEDALEETDESTEVKGIDSATEEADT